MKPQNCTQFYLISNTLHDWCQIVYNTSQHTTVHKYQYFLPNIYQNNRTTGRKIQLAIVKEVGEDRFELEITMEERREREGLRSGGIICWAQATSLLREICTDYSLILVCLYCS